MQKTSEVWGDSGSPLNSAADWREVDPTIAREGTNNAAAGGDHHSRAEQYPGQSDGHRDDPQTRRHCWTRWNG